MKYQKGPSKLGRMKQSVRQPNLAYSSWNITLDKSTPCIPSPIHNHPSVKRLQKKLVSLDPVPNGPGVSRLGINTKLVPTIARGKNIWTKMDILSYQKSVGRCLVNMEFQ